MVCRMVLLEVMTDMTPKPAQSIIRREKATWREKEKKMRLSPQMPMVATMILPRPMTLPREAR